jgi:hypothetical protein
MKLSHMKELMKSRIFIIIANLGSQDHLQNLTLQVKYTTTRRLICEYSHPH